MRPQPSCYRCGKPATTNEHVPPKSFFPRGGNLQLKTVPSCQEHNNGKSGDDQYLLTHITMHAAKGDNLAKRLFLRSVVPQLERSALFRQRIAGDRVERGDGSVAYPVDTARCDRFFDHLCYALYFDKFGESFSDDAHRINHCYLSLESSDPEELERKAFVSAAFREYARSFDTVVELYEADRIDEVVYNHSIIAPAGPRASITIGHTFYGMFEVMSFLTRKPPPSAG